MTKYFWIQMHLYTLHSSIAEPEPVTIFWSVGAESQSRLFVAAPASSLRNAKKKSLVLVLRMNLVQCTIPVYR